MRWALTVVMVLHGLIHVMGFAKAFGFAALPQLTGSISRPMGVLWLATALVMVGAAFVPMRWFWVAAPLAPVLSQVVIVSAWRDAKFGTLANALVLLAVIYGFASEGPFSFRQAYRTAVRHELERTKLSAVVTEADLTSLPAPVQRYVRLSGAIGLPQVNHLKVTWRGRMRGTAQDPWMNFEAEQHNFYGAMPSRVFSMRATRGGLPVDVLHRYVGDAATFQVKVLSLFPMVDARGPALDRAETVTIFNDLCLLVPSRLIDRSITWESLDDRSARAHFTRSAHTVTAELFFNEAGELTDFRSEDRQRASADGKSFVSQRWTTPIRDYRAFGARRVGTFGEARYDDPAGAFAYGEFELQSIEYD
jgi:hypothetical protein